MVLLRPLFFRVEFCSPLHFVVCVELVTLCSWNGRPFIFLILFLVSYQRMRRVLLLLWWSKGSHSFFVVVFFAFSIMVSLFFSSTFFRTAPFFFFLGSILSIPTEHFSLVSLQPSADTRLPVPVYRIPPIFWTEDSWTPQEKTTVEKPLLLFLHPPSSLPPSSTSHSSLVFSLDPKKRPHCGCPPRTLAALIPVYDG